MYNNKCITRQCVSRQITDTYSESAYWAQRLETSADQEMPPQFYEWATSAADLANMAVQSGLGADRRVADAVTAEGPKVCLFVPDPDVFFILRLLKRNMIYPVRRIAYCYCRC